MKKAAMQTNISGKAFYVFLIISALAVFSRAVCASGNEVTNSVEDIPINMKTGVITEVEFPEPIANVTKSVSSELLQVETLGNRAFLLARQEFEAYLHIVTRDNALYVLHLTMNSSAQAVTSIKINKRVETPTPPQNKEIANTIEVMKDLLSGRQPQGSVRSGLNKREIFNNGGFRMVADEIFEFSSGAKAFVVTMENLTDAPIVVPVESIDLPGLLAVSVDSQILEARHGKADKNNSGAVKAYLLVDNQANEKD